MRKPFQVFKLTTGCLLNSCDEKFPTAFYAWNQETLNISNHGTHFGFIAKGEAVLQTDSGTFTLREKMFFCVPDSLQITGGKGIIITRINYQGMFFLGGAIESEGRLRYIDGCHDTLLIPPLLKGDPCLNALYFPTLIKQTPHTHPSVRIGLVAKGNGECVTPNGIFPLPEGSAFIIAPEALHSFNTYDEKMIVIAYHPDSNFGATHEDHPMVNRTMVKGVSASMINEIRTKTD
jgi:hypothetical protein